MEPSWNLLHTPGHGRAGLKVLRRHLGLPGCSWYPSTGARPRERRERKLQANIPYECGCENSQNNNSKPNPAARGKEQTPRRGAIYPRKARAVQHAQIPRDTHTRYRNGGVTPSREQTPASDKLQPPFTVKHSATQEWKELLYHDKGRFFLTTHT